jgi:hypothetical protein
MDKKEHHTKAAQPVEFETQHKRVTKELSRMICDDQTDREGAEQI